jgi:hypothetical protein
MDEPAQESGIVCANPDCRGTDFTSHIRYPGPGFFRRRLICRKCGRSRYTYEIPSEWFHSIPPEVLCRLTGMAHHTNLNPRP